MKVQTNSKSEPKFPKRGDSKLFYFLSHKREELVLICPKSEPEESKDSSKKKKKHSYEKKKEGHNKKFSDLKPSIFYVKNSANNNLCAVCFYAIDHSKSNSLILTG